VNLGCSSFASASAFSSFSTRRRRSFMGRRRGPISAPARATSVCIRIFKFGDSFEHSSARPAAYSLSSVSFSASVFFSSSFSQSVTPSRLARGPAVSAPRCHRSRCVSCSREFFLSVPANTVSIKRSARIISPAPVLRRRTTREDPAA